MICKRQRAFILALLLFTATVFPVKQANAIVPIAVGLAVQALGAGGAVVSADLLTAGVTALIGGTIMAIAITPSTLADGTQGASVRVPTTNLPPSTATAMAAPSAPGTVATVQTKQGNCSCHTSGYTSSASATAATAIDACKNACSQIGSSWNTYWNECNDACAGSTSYVSTCPGGYRLSGSSCTLSSPVAAVVDQKHDLVRSPSGYSSPVNVIDPSTGASFPGEADALPPTASLSNGKVYAYGKNSSGQPVVLEYAVSASGDKTLITHYTQEEIGGQSVVKSQSATIDASTGTVTGNAAVVQQGSITAPSSANAVPTVTTGAAVSPSSSSTSTNSGEISFPTDYARSGEASAAANTIKSSVDALKAPLDPTSTLIDPTVPVWVDPWGVTFDSLKGWSLPAHSSACPTASFDFFGRTVFLDSHCQIVQDHFGAFSAVMRVVWSIAALFVVLGA